MNTIATTTVETTTCQKCGGSGFWKNNHRYTCFACKGTGQMKPATERLDRSWIDMLDIRNHFRLAIEKGISSPKLRLMGSQELPVEFSLAPDYGANKDYIYTKVSGVYTGKIDTEGYFHPVRDCTYQQQHAIAFAAVTDISNNAVLYGRKFGRCSCCGRTLSNPESVKLGIGPICRENYGL